MRLRVQIIGNGQVLFEVPLSAAEWSRKRLEDEFKDSEENFHRFSKLFDVLSHETRLKMMKRLIEEDDRTLSFADFMKELDLNPKIVWENSRKLEEIGFLERTGRGRYSCSEFGQAIFLMMNLALRRLFDLMQETESLYGGENIHDIR